MGVWVGGWVGGARCTALTCGRVEVGLLLLLDGLRVVVGGAFVHGQRGDLLVGFPAVVAVVGLAGRVDHVVLVQAGVLCEALLAARHRAHVGFLTWGEEGRVTAAPGGSNKPPAGCGGHTRVYPHVVFVVCGAGEGASAAGLGAVVRPLARVCPDVDLSDVGGCKRAAAAFDGALERLLPCRRAAGKDSGCGFCSPAGALRTVPAHLCESSCASGGLQMF